MQLLLRGWCGCAEMRKVPMSSRRFALSSPYPKNITVFFGGKSAAYPRLSRALKGRIMIVTKRRVRDAVDAAASSREAGAGPAARPVSDVLACERTALLSVFNQRPAGGAHAG